MPKQLESSQPLVPLTQAAAALRLGYFATRELGLRGILRLQWRGPRVYVERASLERFRNAQQREGLGD